eukprot:CAMPEP_0177638928 /NCGR_PEP_ID=MMETSP0447-20121125/5751_1 /TAXON_ID=0 /ORGANISM="Stygamoeba regulata, Strain BSH-02190019" /LENGTH=45 /DNA_ID= /DNA_START= /DNA_END= /DNA_ORIENTATION=
MKVAILLLALVAFALAAPTCDQQKAACADSCKKAGAIRSEFTCEA